MLTEEELIQIRRHLHQIPELALHEFDTHQYLVETVASFNQAFLEVRTFKELPTALMVLVHGQKIIGGIICYKSTNNWISNRH